MASDVRQLGHLGHLIEEIRIGGWLVRHFEQATICSHTERGTFEIPRAIRDYWKNGLIERRGFPVGPLRDAFVADRPVKAMDFERGVFFWDAATDVVFDASSASDSAVIAALGHGLFGRWDPAFEAGVVGVHAALLHTNHVLFWTYDDDGATIDVSVKGEWSLLSLTTGKVIARETSDRNQFCSGQCLLGDGNVLAVGGDRKSDHNGHELNARTMLLFDPVAREWRPLSTNSAGAPADLEVGRWYPTVVTYGATTAIVLAGRDRTSPADTLDKSVRSALFINEGGLTGPQRDFDKDFGRRSGDLGDTYPFGFVLPTGHLFVHLANLTRLPALPNLDFGTARKALDATGARTYDEQGTAVMLPLRPTDSPPYRARVMLIGGGPEAPPPAPAKNSCVIMDTSVPNPAWAPAKFMHDPRHMGDAVLLPDGKVLVVNGGTYGHTTSSSDARLAAELYDPATNEWARMASMATPRLYHSTALLLPDGRVLSTGTDRTWNIEKKARPNIEVFSPPYLFHGPRPVIESAPERVGYGETFLAATDQAPSIKSAVLIRTGSCTHSFNSDQRFIELEIVERLGPRISVAWERVVSAFRSLVYSFRWPNLTTSRALRLRVPPNELVAPAGYYMLFLMSEHGVPSVARFIRLGGRRAPWFTVTRVEGRWQRD